MSDLKRIHTLNISKKITITGVVNVEAFDDKNVLIELSECLLTLNGMQLLIDSYSIEDGTLALTGNVIEIKYSKTREKVSLLKKLLK